ncbi:UDP-N-acetylglucosamine 2-epimerase [Caminibacter mediatlanticus]|uniref:UDP-N-acetylglucosamine 2-epimerase n=1 Tax=Caminibacter mediatlanticus TB-2 TaxID=391592 RepID=A0AAI9F1W0_9BACT|nr:UDP-N-acetylglucosamine 2-epimerase [Caminibacter mediatlanticus]EDM23163.1 UDP-N-acetylglucosamine 2-epimerase [Caminibacter mediatlanticus TB-2]
MKNICVVTSTRAEYGLLYWLMKEIENDKKLQLQLIVTGSHLSPEFGMTIKEIEKEFKIDKKIEMLLSSDSKIGISKSMGLLQISIAEAFEELKPDFLVVLGDRYELIPIVSTAVVFNIPVVHLHGGEITQGAIDEYFRHAVTKMSYLHFTSTEEYKKRVIQMGEEPNRVFNVGAFGVENIFRLKLLNKKEFEDSINFKLNKKNLLITYHPETLNTQNTKKDFKEILDVLDELKDTNFIFTKANSDTNGRIINKMIDEYVSKNGNKAISFDSLGQIRYLSALKHVDAVIGNSSSGIIEAPSFKTATINIGNRQKGRIKAKSIIDCEPKKESIKKAFEKLYSKEFQELLKSVKNPYQKEKYPSKKVVDVLKNFEVKSSKNFYDMECKGIK